MATSIGKRFAGLATAAIAPALVLTISVDRASAASPSLSAEVNGVESEETLSDALRFERFDLSVRSHGSVADATLDVVIGNSGQQDEVEANFEFQMPRGAAVTGYAIDLADEDAQGRLVDGVLLEQAKAKRAYDDQVRGEIDPGLAEVSREGLFSTSIFPVTAGGTRHMRLRFSFPIGAGLEIPLETTREVGQWSVRWEFEGLDARPELALPGALSVERAGQIVSAGGVNSRIAGVVRLAAPDIPEVLISKHANGDEFVHLSGRLPEPQARNEPPGLLRIYWDTSLSRKQGDLSAERKLAAQLVDAIGPGAVELVLFNSERAEGSAIAAADLAARLGAIHYGGGSSFGPLAAQDRSEADLCLLFFDGVITIDRAAEFDPDCPLHAISTAPGANLPLLSAFARDHGGRFFDAVDGGKAEAAIRSIVGDAPVLQSVRGTRGKALPFIELPAAPGQWAAIVKSQRDTEVTVRLGTNSRSFRRPILLDAEAQDYDGAGVLWARDQLARREGDLDRKAFLEFARNYSVEVPGLSFLVLERPEEYVEHDIAPAANYPAELMAEYREERARVDEDEREEAEERFTDLLDDWGDLKDWWESEYERRPPLIIGQGANETPAPPPPGPTIASVGAPAMAMASAPAQTSAVDQIVSAEAAPADEGFAGGGYDDEGLDIVVTGSRIQNVISVAIDAWQPDRPYLKALDAAPADFDTVFAAQEAEHGGLPAFYLDVARWLDQRGERAKAVEVLLSALELPVADAETRLIVAQRLQRMGRADRAIELLEYFAATQPEVAQPARHLALALIARARSGQSPDARADYARALELLNAIATNPVKSGDEGIDMIALVEANAALPAAQAAGARNPLDRRLVALLDTDLRVVFDWTTESTDLDLWVNEPTGERAYYGYQLTQIGGHMSDDMTDGYGPEEYMIRRAIPGEYEVRAHVYSSDRINPNGVSILTARLIRNFGRPDESEEYIDIELRGEDGDDKHVGTLTVGQ